MHGGVYLAQNGSQVLDFRTMRPQALDDVPIQYLLHVQQLLRQLLILLGKLLVLLCQALNVVRLLMVPDGAHIGGDEKNRASERRLKAQ